MVKFSLLCEKAHDFEAWFQSNESFETQRSENQIYCPHCASSSVRKALMAPNLSSPKIKARSQDIDDTAQRAQIPSSQSATQSSPAMARTDTQPVMQGSNTATPDQTVPARQAKADMPNMQQMAQMVRHMHQLVAENCTNVGPKFADEARKMHQGETAAKPLYGTSTAEERAELTDEGIAFAQLPDMPKDN